MNTFKVRWSIFIHIQTHLKQNASNSSRSNIQNLEKLLHIHRIVKRLSDYSRVFCYSTCKYSCRKTTLTSVTLGWEAGLDIFMIPYIIIGKVTMWAKITSEVTIPKVGIMVRDGQSVRTTFSSLDALSHASALASVLISKRL